eukprot:TRINITY_DN2046_c1_g1_i8.p1 TRINITY_DN2046_c1_g1~~TRINITY_DN2046_c1_g1_i8.p1  ORF type:complete len:329 (-),score=10.25 TRINITY_DN2046_c1_g1_i8:184-1113(-)
MSLAPFATGSFSPPPPHTHTHTHAHRSSLFSSFFDCSLTHFSSFCAFYRIRTFGDDARLTRSAKTRSTFQGVTFSQFSDRSQLRSQQTSIEDHYQNIVHPGVRVAAETPTCLRGSTSVEDWTVPAMDYKLAALRTATGMTTEELRDAAVAVRIRPSLHITGFRHDIHAVAVHRSTEGFDGVLLQSGAVAHFGVLPWARLAELVEIDFGDDETRSFALIDCPRWNDPERPLDPDTGAPWLRFEGNFLLIPVAYIDRKLWLWHDIRERTAEVVLANWWVTVGDFRYPEHRRRTVQTELGWRREFYAARVPD